MGTQLVGQGGQLGQIDGSHRAHRFSPRPTDHGTLGHYSISVTIALAVSQAANGTLFSMRWGNTTGKVCVPLRIKLKSIQTANHTANLLDERYQCFVARGFTGSDSVGTAVVLTGNNSKMRTNMGTSLVTDMRFAAVAAGLTVGTRLLDANPFFQLCSMYVQTTAATAYQPGSSDEWKAEPGATGICPIVLAQDEGWIVRGPTTVFGVAGTANLIVEYDWMELVSYDNAQLG